MATTTTELTVQTKHRAEKTPAQDVKDYKWDIYWPNTIVLVVLHLLAVYGMLLRSEAKPGSEVFWKTYAFVSSLGITAGAHRLWCHKSYKATTLGQIILMFFASLTYQNSVYIWSRDHRMHHRYSETDADPHNSKRGFFFSHVGWLMVRKHKELKAKKNTVDMSDLEANPIVMFQHKYYYPVVFFCAIFISTFVPWYFWGESLKVSFFRVTIYRYVVSVNLTWCINSVAHMFGTKPYDKNIGPVEAYIMKYAAPGEGFHNYHHTYPWDYRASEFGNDTRNAPVCLIDFMALFGLAYDLKAQPEEVVKARMKRTGDGSFSANKTIFAKYIPASVDKIVKNLWNAMLHVAVLYLF